MAKSGKKFEVVILNPIAQVGLKRLPAERYEVVKDSKAPDVILVAFLPPPAAGLPGGSRPLEAFSLPGAPPAFTPPRSAGLNAA